jgi:zeaxanthin glucosyltransferase
VARFLVVVVPFTARLWPAIAIGDGLAAAGHEVAWCGPERDLRPLVGPDPAIYPTGKRSYREFHEVGLAAVREHWDEFVLPFTRFIQGPVDRAVAEFAPDVVLADQYALAGAIAAHRNGIRWATLSSGVLELTPPAEPGLQDWVASRLAKARQTAGLPADDGVDLRFSPYLMLATTTQALTGLTALPEHFALVGATLGPRRNDPAFPWDWWDPARRHVLFTAGTLSDHLVLDFVARMEAALAPMADTVQAVFNTVAQATPDPPPNVLVAPRVPMLEVMARADVVICSGGQSSVNESLLNGVPLVVYPIRLGELAVAEQVTRTGCGVSVSFAHASPADLAAAVTAVLDEPGYRKAAAQLKQEYAAAGGTAAAVARLTALAANP